MTDSCIRPDFSMEQAKSLALELYGLEGELRQLPGERDLNFLLQTAQGRFVLKIANDQEDPALLLCQHRAIERIDTAGVFDQVGSTVFSLDGNAVERVSSDSGKGHAVRMVRYVGGRLLSQVKPHTPDLLERVGEKLALLDRALDGFSHAALSRPLLWEIHNGAQVLERFRPLLQESDRQNQISAILGQFERIVLPVSKRLRRGVIHNDANDNNVLVGGDDPWSLEVAGIIDFGDMIESWIAAEPAIAAAYAMLGKEHPLDEAASVVRGYHRKNPLTEVEVASLYPLMRMRLAMSVSICAYQQSLDPDNDYLRISEAPAWELLDRLDRVPPDYAHFLFRHACGYEPVPATAAIVSWLKSMQGRFASIVDPDLSSDPVLIIDTSVGSANLGTPGGPIDMQVESRKLSRAIEDTGSMAGIGRYAEYRLIYDSDDFVDFGGHRRTLHLGIDVFQPAGSPVYAPISGKVFGVADNDAPLDYGGTVILEHRANDEDRFHTLYGHLSPESISGLSIGDPLEPGDRIGVMGDIHENGHWPPHVHFEIITDILDQTDSFAGVGSHAHRDVWLSLCPDPNIILGIPQEKLADKTWHREQILENRRQHLNPSLSLSYREPIHMARGGYQYLYDATGRSYLDAVNNVPHVGHCHPRVVAAQQSSASVLNTNTRYLYQEIVRYSEMLLERFPAPLEVCYFTCSGSEANDLALRLARNYTGRRDVVVLDHAYHGNLGSLIDVSPYKHDGRGGCGTPGHVHKAIMPDTYRGRYRDADDEAASKYARDVARALDEAAPNGGASVFLAESMLGCGGQIVLPPGYLQKAYGHAREAGALCIADEVQVGFGRVGDAFWAFETQGVVPDIVTLGKPIGNGHPMAAVITTRDIADRFNNGMEYFNTFAGNPVSCAIGTAVLEVIAHESLQDNARHTGALLIEGLQRLTSRYPLVGDVRGKGLFIGVELVNDRATLEPASDQAAYIVERMKQEGVLISTDGPLDNVLKIKPPLCFNNDNATQLTATLESILGETFAQPVSD